MGERGESESGDWIACEERRTTGGVWRKLRCEFDDFFYILVGWLKETTKAVVGSKGRKEGLFMAFRYITIKHSSNIYYKTTQ